MRCTPALQFFRERAAETEAAKAAERAGMDPEELKKLEAQKAEVRLNQIN
jgi:hypothetical protein